MIYVHDCMWALAEGELSRSLFPSSFMLNCSLFRQNRSLRRVESSVAAVCDAR